MDPGGDGQDVAVGFKAEKRGAKGLDHYYR